MDTKPAGIDGEGARRFMKAMAAANVWIYRRSGGRLGRNWRFGIGFRNPVPICLLEHRGRLSGSKRTTPLVYLREGDRVVVAASNVGRAEDPQWLANLVADPDVVVQIGADRLPMRARVADADERDRLWPALVALYADYAQYQSWTDRVIPVVVLEPR